MYYLISWLTTATDGSVQRLTLGLLWLGPSNLLSSLLSTGLLTVGGGLPLCVLVGLCPDVDDPPSELKGGVRFWGFRLNIKYVTINNNFIIVNMRNEILSKYDMIK